MGLTFATVWTSEVRQDDLDTGDSSGPMNFATCAAGATGHESISIPHQEIVCAKVHADSYYQDAR